MSAPGCDGRGQRVAGVGFVFQPSRWHVAAAVDAARRPKIDCARLAPPVRRASGVAAASQAAVAGAGKTAGCIARSCDTMGVRCGPAEMAAAAAGDGESEAVCLEEAVVVSNDVIGTAGGRLAEHKGLRESPETPKARLDAPVG